MGPMPGASDCPNTDVFEPLSGFSERTILAMTLLLNTAVPKRGRVSQRLVALIPVLRLLKLQEPLGQLGVEGAETKGM